MSKAGWSRIAQDYVTLLKIVYNSKFMNCFSEILYLKISDCSGLQITETMKNKIIGKVGKALYRILD